MYTLKVIVKKRF